MRKSQYAVFLMHHQWVLGVLLLCSLSVVSWVSAHH